MSTYLLIEVPICPPTDSEEHPPFTSYLLILCYYGEEPPRHRRSLNPPPLSLCVCFLPSPVLRLLRPCLFPCAPRAPPFSLPACTALLSLCLLPPSLSLPAPPFSLPACSALLSPCLLRASLSLSAPPFSLPACSTLLVCTTCSPLLSKTRALESC